MMSSNGNIESFCPVSGWRLSTRPRGLRTHTDAQKLTPADVHSLTISTFAEHGGVDAIYFQGALLDPLMVLEEMETELSVPIVASNPAMLWFVLSKLGLSYEISGYGKLLSSWPTLPEIGLVTSEL